jgi:osmotically-inducible protein OsmY
MDDITLRHNVTETLERLPLINAADIGVAASDGVVTLTGCVRNASHRMLIEFAVLKLDGVRALAQVIDVCEDTDSLNTDEEIAKRVIRMIGWNTSIPDAALRVRVQKGWVTLTGHVASREQSERVASVARQARGVVGVSDLLKTETAPISLETRRRIKSGDRAVRDGREADVVTKLVIPTKCHDAVADRDVV